jgi:hypothetical protein
MPETLDPSKPAGHIAQIPAGHKRDEENRRRTDTLAEQAEQATDLGGGDVWQTMSPERLREYDNEILRELEGGAAGGSPLITNPVPGFRYLWVKVSGGPDIQAHIQANIDVITALGYVVVEDPMPEAKNLRYKGAEGASGSYRGWGDCRLYRVSNEQYAKLGRYRQILNNRQQNIEEAYQAYGEKYAPSTLGNRAHGRRDDDLLRRTVYAGGFGETVTVERQLRQGTIPGIRPGDDVR